jgi:hypothetical protein
MDNKKFTDLLEKDYANALVHLFCVNTIADKSYSLGFGFVELYPVECSGSPIETEWQSLGLPEYRLFYRRKLLSVREGVSFYAHARLDDPFEFQWNEKRNIISTGGLLSDSAFEKPYLSDNSKLPFIAVPWDVVRVHSLFPADNSKLLRLLSYQKIAEWLEGRLCFNLIRAYPELVGSMHLCMPNPLYRSCKKRLIPGDGTEYPRVQFHFVPRENCGQELQSLELCLLEKRLYGYAGGDVISVPGEYSEIPLIGGDEKVGSIIHCPLRGLLDYSEFNNFFHKLQVSLRVQEETFRVTVRNEVTNQETTKYVEKERIASDFIVGPDHLEGNEIQELGARIRHDIFNKETRKLAASLGQFLCDAPGKSKDYVTEVINQASSKVIIIDPYFDPQGLLEYVVSIKLMHIVPEIIVSAEGLKQAFQKQERRAAKLQTPETEYAVSFAAIGSSERIFKTNADIFEELLSHEHFKDKVTISVMPGMGAFHDRFLITDERVWLSGNSLNSLGERLSIIIRLPDGSGVLNALERLRDKGNLKPFTEWLTDFRQARLAQEGGANGQTH